MYKIDLHTHSIASRDGGLKAADYKNAIQSGKLDFIAVTDHNTIDFASRLNAEIGDQIIIGEEITTNEGEVIGLYLKKNISAGLDLKDVVNRIKSQGGLVYVPHPFETVRSGLSRESLDKVAKYVDIIETYNGRAVFQDKSRMAQEWSMANNVPGASSSDAHGSRGWLKTYSTINSKPNMENLVVLMGKARLTSKKVGVLGIFYPKLNRIKKTKIL